MLIFGLDDSFGMELASGMNPYHPVRDSLHQQRTNLITMMKLFPCRDLIRLTRISNLKYKVGFWNVFVRKLTIKNI